MKAGLFHHRVTVQAPTDAKGTTGALSTTWADLASRWADVLPTKSREYERLKLRFAEMEAAYRIRGYLAVTLKHRLVHDTQTLEIIGVDTEGNRLPANAEWITLVCRGRR
jgi:head-tail adaptor